MSPASPHNYVHGTFTSFIGLGMLPVLEREKEYRLLIAKNLKEETGKLFFGETFHGAKNFVLIFQTIFFFHKFIFSVEYHVNTEKEKARTIALRKNILENAEGQSARLKTEVHHSVLSLLLSPSSTFPLFPSFSSHLPKNLKPVTRFRNPKLNPVW
jgi:hypothetical protein